MYLKNVIRSIKSFSPIVCCAVLFTLAFTLKAQNFNLHEASSGLPHISGISENADYLYTTAGDKLYCIGNQMGNFPKVGFHVPGQMGGVWQHPIKLLDGFELDILNPENGKSYTSLCDSFTSYPFLSTFTFHTQGQPIRVARTQFVPDNIPVLVIEYNIENNSEEQKSLQLEFNASVNLMPVWLSERIGISDKADILFAVDNAASIIYFRDKGNSWFTGIGFDNDQIKFKETKETSYADNGITAVSSLTCEIPPKGTYTFHVYVSGSLLNAAEIEQNIVRTKKELPSLFSAKKQRYENIANTAKIEIPDKAVETAYLWGKYTTDWLRRDVSGLGKGLSAGLPDYPWFFSNDQATTFMALVGTLDPQLFFDSFDMLKRVSNKVNNSNGSIVHEISSNEVVFSKDRMEESQLHIIAAWEIFKWTGNLSFLKENYEFAQKTWAWLQQHDTNGNGYIEGNGGTEIEGLDDEMFDVQVNTFRFLEIMSQMALIFQDKHASDLYAQKALKLRDQLDKDWWIESEKRYADFIAPKDKALKIINDALEKRIVPGRNEWARAKLEDLKKQVVNNTYPYKGYVVYYNPSGLSPMEIGMADIVRAKEMLANATFFTNRFGEYINGIERPDNVSIDEKRFQKDSVFTYNRAVMPVATSGLIEAAARLGMPDTAWMYMRKITNSFSYATPGTVYEVSPDYGMFVQAWNVTGINTPLIQHFFGVNPHAYKKEITIHLQMPKDWEYANLKDLLIGGNRLTIQYTKSKDFVTCKIYSKEIGWKIHFVTDKNIKSVLVNKKMIQPVAQVVELLGCDNVIQLRMK